MEKYRSALINSSLGAGLRPLPTPYQLLGHYWRRRVNLTKPGSYSIVVPTLNPEDKNSVVNIIFQVKLSTTVHTTALYSLYNYTKLLILKVKIFINYSLREEAFVIAVLMQY